MSEIIYPTLDLFIYNLREGLGENPQDIAKNHANFWANLPDEFKVPLSEEEKADYPEYIRLLEFSAAAGNQKQYYLKSSDAGYPLETSYYPVRLNDAYGLLFGCSIDDKSNPQPIISFQKLASLAAGKKGDLGKTWMLSGKYSLSADEETLAKEAYKNFTSQEWQSVKKGSFIGGTVFEIWQPPQKWQNVEAENSHVLIFLYPNIFTMQKAASFYADWLRLFCYRNKIIWAYGEAQKRRVELQRLFVEIRNNFEIVQNITKTNNEQRLTSKELKLLQQNLNKNLGIVANYITRLSYLEILQQTIATNLENYNQCLKNLVEKASDLAKKDSRIGNTDIKFLEEFSRIAEHKYQAQIAKDYASFSPGSRLLENLTDTIRGIVEIERTQRDRTLNNTVATAGIGLATSQVAASVILAKPDAAKHPTTVFFSSLGIGILFSLLSIIILRLIRP